MMPSATAPADLTAAVRDLCGSNRASLTEPDAQEITRLLGIGVPMMVRAGDADEASRAELPGDRVVVKAIGPLHKSDVGGVRVTPNRPADIAAAARAVAAAAEGPLHDGFLVAEYIEHEPASEILAGVRWTEAFGPVVTLGRGGLAAEAGPAPAIVARATADDAADAVSGAEGTRGLIAGWRGGGPAATVPQLAELIAALLDLGEAAMPHDLVAFEINPLVFTAAGPTALDALAIVGKGPRTADPPRPIEAIARQLRPTSIAVMGVSRRMNPGKVVLHNILAAGFPSQHVVVIKRGTRQIDGCRCVPDLASLREPVDLLVLAVPAEAVPDIVDEAVATAAAHSIVIVSGGLGEVPGTEKAAERIRATIREARLEGGSIPVITGPNSMGLRSSPGGYDATFIPAQRSTMAEGRPAPVAVVAQSGAFTLSRLDRLARLDPRYVVTTGNQLDLTIGDYLEHFSHDPDVAIVACYVEGLAPGDGDRALRAAASLRDRGGTLLWYRGGRTPAGARSAASHTAAIATDDVVARALAEAGGIVEADGLDDFDDLLRLAVHLYDKPIEGGRLAVISNAGFECVAAADALGGLRLAEFSSATAARLELILENAGLDRITAVRNPLDLTPIAGDRTYAAVVKAVLSDPDVDLAVVGCVPFTPSLQTLPDQVGSPGSLSDRLGALANHPAPWVAVVDAGRLYDPLADALEARAVPVIRSMDRAVRLLGRYAASRLSRPGVVR